MGDFSGKSKQGGRGGGSRGFLKNPQMKAAKRKLRDADKFPSYDRFLDDATVYTTAGSHVFSVPRGVDSLRIHMYGAGGAGGSKSGKVAGCGGGGGAFVGLTLSEIAKGDTITFVIGAAGVTHASNPGTTGGDTYFQWVDGGGTAHGYTAGGGGSGINANTAGTDNGGIATGMTSQGRNPGLGSTQGVVALQLIDGERGNGGSAVFGGTPYPQSSGGTGGTTDSATGLAMNDFARGGSGEFSGSSTYMDGKPGLVYIF